ncbi:hypothetical protein F4861DRAFT_337668 [Xylaria intraflava]|nr:hypothetical protein F4861DRAFT_337668 [Xylaria intraflava]
MDATTAELSDDWQHVDDSDTFSVISLPMSEDDTLTSSLVRLPSSSSHDLIHPSHKPDGPTRSESHFHHLDGALDESQVLEKYDMDMVDAIPPDYPQIQPAEIANDLVGLDALHEKLGSLVKLLSDAISTLSRGQHHPPAAEIKAQCEMIRSRLMCLQDILYTYTKHRGGENTYTEHPIDPGLLEWIENLKSELVGVQTTFKEPRNTGLHATTATTWALRVKDHREQLEHFSCQIHGLMAVVQTDFADVHTPRPPTPPTSQGALSTHPHRPRRPTPTAGSSMFHLRRTLYALRDQIVTFLDEIYSCERHGIADDSDQRTNRRTSTLNYKKIKESLELMLSNHGSEWIDYGLAGGLTYPEFCRLNPDTIRSLVFQLKEVTDDLFLERCRLQSLRYGQGPDSFLNDENLVIKESSMTMLRTIEEVLTSIFQIRTDF